MSIALAHPAIDKLAAAAGAAAEAMNLFAQM
jgi:hypothetical protein